METFVSMATGFVIGYFLGRIVTMMAMRVKSKAKK